MGKKEDIAEKLEGLIGNKSPTSTGDTSIDVKAEIEKLIGLDPVERELERDRIAKKYKIRKSIIDEYITHLKPKEEPPGREVVSEVEPAAEAVNGAQLLNTISRELSRYVILPLGSAVAIALWVMLTYCYDAFRVLPLLAALSPEKRCGKTTLLEVLLALVYKGLAASNISSAAVYRTVDICQPALLVDEADTFLKDNDELRGVFNSGHTKALAFVVRCEGDDNHPEKYSTWGPKVIAMIGQLPATLEDRSIVVPLRRKIADEKIAKLDIEFERHALHIRQKCRRWADDNFKTLCVTRPEVPHTGNDRATDNWQPLFAIAEVAGGDWPIRVKESMGKLLSFSDETTIGPKLLADIRDIFEEGFDTRMFSADLVDRLIGLEERPWGDWNKGKGLNQNKLANLLKPFQIRSKQIRIGDQKKRGYAIDQFVDSFERYLFNPLRGGAQSGTAVQTNDISRIGQNQGGTT